MIHILPTPWMRHADCVGHNPDLWFPKTRDHSTARQAKNICRQCPVQTECLQHAQQHDIRWGIWGGLTPTERRRQTARRRTPGQCLNGHIQNERTSYTNNEGHRACRVCRRGYQTDDPPNKGLAGKAKR